MAYTYKTELLFTLSDGATEEPHRVKLEVKFTVNRARSATLEEPGEGASVSIHDAHIVTTTGIYRNAEVAPNWLWPFLESDEALQSEMLTAAVEDDEYARDQAADARREESRL
jgi:hypothetical protein